MRVRYFPHTQLTDEAARAAVSLFGEITLITTKADMELPSGVKALGPEPGEAQKLDALLQGWRQFSGLHEEGMQAYTLGGCREFDPVGEQLSTQIRSELMRQIEGAETESQGRCLAARAYLSLAEEHGQRQRELESGLSALGEVEAELLGELKGELEGIPPYNKEALFGVDSSAGDMEKRLGAWASLFLEEKGEGASDRVFVTHSREAFELVEEFTPSLKFLGNFKGTRLDDKGFRSLLSGALPEMAGEAPVCARIYIAGSEHVSRMFNRFADLFQKSEIEGVAQGFDFKGEVLIVRLD